MKFNDPFGRMERRHQAGYAAMRDSLIRGGIKSREEALELIKQSRQRALKIFGTAVLIFFLVAGRWREVMPIALFLLLLLGVWLLNSTINGRRYIMKFVEEELKQDN